jgi:hypothetical protein
MPRLLSRDQWCALRKLYIAGQDGIPFDGVGYRDAGSWKVLVELRELDPPFLREVFRPSRVEGRGQHLVIITDAGERFYDQNEELHNAFYPPD